MKIYFAGSIRSGRRDQPYQKCIIEILQKYGQVLTVHIGAKDLPVWGEDNISDSRIFQRDSKWLNAADVVVAEVSTPSLGVGYEIGIARSRKKPILCLFREKKGRRMSPMIAGNPLVILKKYNNRDEIAGIIESFVNRTKHRG